MKMLVSVFLLFICAAGGAYAQDAGKPCYNVCGDCSGTESDAKCSALGSDDKRICYALYASCERQSDGSCGWSARNASMDMAKCLDNPSRYRNEYKLLKGPE